MKTRTKALRIAMVFLLQWAVVSSIHAQSGRISEAGRTQAIFLSVSPPPKDRMTLVSVVPIMAQGKAWGGIAAYDDPRTQRPADYIEVYDDAGTLLAVGWFDKFGIERLAVDRAFVENASQPKGVFVLILTGDAV